MAEEKKKKNEGEFDIFFMNSVYPEADAIFTSQLKPLDELIGESIIVLDTNALLVPYNIGKESLSQIHETYRYLVSQNRLLIPGQVAREFAKNRANKIGEIYQQFNRKMNSIATLRKGNYPLLESTEKYQKAVELEDKIDTLIKEYREAVQDVLAEIRAWDWNDPVSVIYSQLFTKDVICDLVVDKAKVAAELIRRQTHSIPPGYKDAAKDDNGIGDFLIWLTILDLGQKHNKSVFFVSGEEKADWQYRSENRALYPRYELIDEFRRNSNGQTFNIVSFSQLLNIYGASESTVQEVRREEKKLGIELGVVGLFLSKWQEFEKLLNEKCKIVGIEIDSRRVSILRMTQSLYEKEEISSSFFARTRDIMYFRNRMVHQQVDVPVNEIRQQIALLEELSLELKLDLLS